MKALMKKLVAGAVVVLAATASAKTAVTPPTIASKVYTGAAQKADVADTDEWQVLMNSSRTDVGTNTVTLVLNDSDVYEWAAADGVTIDGDVCQIPFVITKAANEWTTEPAMAGWTWGEAVPTPVGAAKFGTVSLTYSGTTKDGTPVSNLSSVTAAGDYTAHFKVVGTSNYDGLEQDVDFTVAVGTISGGGGGSGSGATLNATDYSGKYDGQPHSAIVNVSGAAGEVFEVTYATEEFGTYSLTKPTWTAAGNYTMWYKITSTSYAEFKGSLTVNISKAGVTPPTIASKPYTGATQTADVPSSDLYEVVANFGGKSVGNYMVVLQLADSANYDWAPTEGVTIDANDGIAEILFAITKATNVWTTEPAMAGWTWGEAVPTPAGKAKFGDNVKLTFSGTTTSGASVSGATSVTAPGNYTALFKVEGTDDYEGLEKSVSVVVAVGQVNVDPSSPAEPRLVVTDYEGVYDGAAHSNLVQIVGAGSETFTIGYATSEDGPFVAEAPTFTDACEETTVWYSVTSPNFAPVKGFTTLKIAKRPIMLTSGDGTWEQDGVAHSNVTVTVGGDGFVAGEGATYSGFPVVSTEGTCENTFTVTFNDGTLAGNYDISYAYGTLTITAAPALTVTVGTPQVSDGAVLLSVAVTASAPWGAVDADALAVEYRATLDAAPTRLASKVVSRAADGTVTVEVTPPQNAGSGFFTATLAVEE